MPAQPYKPDPLADTGQKQTPFKSNVPQTGAIVNSLIRLAMRRLPAYGYGTQQSSVRTKGSGPPAVTMGSHGMIK